MKYPPGTFDIQPFLDEFNKETDRGAVLVCASVLDETLKELLMTFFPDTPSSKSLLSGGNAPIGTFSSRIDLCHALGLIQDDEHKELTLIRKIRNEFAHKWEDISFESQKIRDLSANLPDLISHLDENQVSTRLHFITVSVKLLMRFRGLSVDLGRKDYLSEMNERRAADKP